MPIADYKQFLNLRAGRTYHLGYYPPKAASLAKVDRIYSEGLPNPTKVTCGDCNEPMLSHPVFDLWGDVTCKRPLSSFHIDSDWDYYADTFLTLKEAQPAPYYESDSDSDGDYDYALDTYRDEHPEEFTSALNWWSSTRSGVYAPATKQSVGNLPTSAGDSAKGAPVYVDEVLFTSVQVFDPTITQRLNLKFYNYYVDQNTGDNRLGGLVLTRDGNLFRAKCVRNDWNSNRCASRVLSIDTSTATYDEMVEFTLNVIRHGNNHAAPWFTKRESFYKVHTETCDLNCNPDAATCNIANASITDDPKGNINLEALANLINSQRVA